LIGEDPHRSANIAGEAGKIEFGILANRSAAGLDL
jgi:hypothetical protein